MEIFWHGPDISDAAESKLVALTFDDGPDSVWTPRVLEALSHYRVKATFLCLGTLIQKNPQMLRRIVSEGHVVGNHSWNHPFFTQISSREIHTQIERTTREITRFVGVRPNFFRPPYGEINDAVTKEVAALNYIILQWSINSYDYNGLAGSEIASNILPHVRPGSIILQHCAAYDHTNSLAGTVDALPEIIETLLHSGYSLVTVPDMLKVPAYL